MKNLVYILSLTLTLQSFAQDMSGTENYDAAYSESEDGSSYYVGGCSTHEDYFGKFFIINETLVEYFEPSDDKDDRQKISVLEPELVRAAKKVIETDSLSAVDDLTVEKISSLKFRNLNLYRLNVGVGGGNGMFLVFNRTIKNYQIVYELLSYVMDGGVEFCDSKVWLEAKN